MDEDTRYVRPVFLIEGGNYLRLEAGHNGHDFVVSKVTFTAYDACPAFVIVRNEYGDKQRCPRECLYINNHLPSQVQ